MNDWHDNGIFVILRKALSVSGKVVFMIVMLCRVEHRDLGTGYSRLKKYRVPGFGSFWRNRFRKRILHIQIIQKNEITNLRKKRNIATFDFVSFFIVCAPIEPRAIGSIGVNRTTPLEHTILGNLGRGVSEWTLPNFWSKLKIHHEELPHLATMALRYLCVQASNVSS